jgi:hypothetical protein
LIFLDENPAKRCSFGRNDYGIFLQKVRVQGMLELFDFGNSNFCPDNFEEQHDHKFDIMMPIQSGLLFAEAPGVTEEKGSLG